MANIDRIVNVQISLNTAGVTKEGFSTMMVVGPHSYDLSRVLSVSDIDELTELGFASEDPITIAVNTALSQIPRPSQVKVGRMQCNTVRLALNGDVVEDATYQVAINYLNSKGDLVEETYRYVAEENDDESNVLNTLAEKINSMVDEENSTEDNVVLYQREDKDNNKVVINANPSGSTLVITCTEDDFSFVVKPNSMFEIISFGKATSMDLNDQMALITSADDDFYGIVYASREQSDILEMAEWTESHTKLFGTAIGENGVKFNEITNDTGSVLKEKGFFRTFWFFHENASTEYPEAAVMARCFAIYPGGETWANKRLNNVTADKLQESQYQAITKKNGNTFESFRNIAITQNGVVASGEWIDVIRFRDWLVEEIKTEEYAMLINKDKLPYTDAGIAIVESVLNSVLQLGQRRGGIAPTEYDEYNKPNYGYVVTVPKASSISSNVKASRKLTDVKFVARLAGAIHIIDIKGSLTYETLQE